MRLLLTPFVKDHITPEYLAALNDKDFMRYSEQRHYTHTQDSCQAYLSSFKGSPNYFWSVGGKGTMTAYVDEHNRRADMGIMMWERGLANQAWREGIDFLFSEGVEMITAGTMQLNGAMVRVMQKSGMVTRLVPDYFLVNGRRESLISAYLLK